VAPVLDVVGIGFGPSNLALAIAISEHNASASYDRHLTARFLEKRKDFGWHQGMLLEDATMQVSFLKDLATLRNPCSSFSFISYLQDRGRLVDFINHKTMFPSRIEFHDYLEWAAARFKGIVEYGVDVIDVRPVTHDGKVAELETIGVVAENGRRIIQKARNIVIATGITPSMPSGVKRTERVIHSSELLDVLGRGIGTPHNIVVIGAGQSAAEVTAYLYSRFREAKIFTVYERYGYSPADDSPFANQVFDPTAVDDYYYAPPEIQRKFYEYHSNTNYSVVDPPLIDKLYGLAYQEKVTGRRRLETLRMSRVTQFTPVPEGALLKIESGLDGTRRELAADLTVCATGYDPMNSTGLLTGVLDLCQRDADGRFDISRDYQISTGEHVVAGIYTAGGTEHTHGLSSSLLSNVSVRAGEILAAITKSTPTPK
jgi:L-ornithine N5-monooxygenase